MEPDRFYGIRNLWKILGGEKSQNSDKNTNDRRDLDDSVPSEPTPSQTLACNAELVESQGQQLQSQPLGGSFFHSSSDVAISGVTNFTSDSSRNHNTNFTIVLNPHSGVPSLGQVGQSTSSSIQYHTSIPPTDVQQLPQSGGDGGARGFSPTQQEYSAATHQIPTRRSSLPVQKSSAIYYRHLASKGRGSPLWIPEPSINLPIAYQRQGIDIGDVGILTDHGSFHFLFNICTPAGDPINPEEMPAGFQPLPKPKSWDVDEHIEFKSNSYLASSLVETLQHDEDSAGLIFESSASEGAILTMPNGSRSKDLVNVVNFRRYAYANAEKWYKYANEVRGRGARNGDLRLVIGSNSSSAWGMATFANLSTSNANPSNNQSGFRLKFKPIKENNMGKTYGWECSGTAEVKSGPDSAEIEKLRNGGECGRGEGDVVFENQCLFVRTLNVTLQNDVWGKLSEEWAGLYLDDELWSESESRPSLAGHSGAQSGDKGGSVARDARGGTSQDSAPRDRDSRADSPQPSNSTSPSPRQRGNPVLLSSLPTPLDFHPSKMINEFLLRERPNLRMAITEDQDWISALNMDEQGLPTQQIICERLIAIYDIHEEEGAIFLQPKSAAKLELPSLKGRLGFSPWTTGDSTGTEKSISPPVLDLSPLARTQNMQSYELKLKTLFSSSLSTSSSSGASSSESGLSSSAENPAQPPGLNRHNGKRMLNGRVYGSKRPSALNANLSANARDGDVEFVEWGYGGMSSVMGAKNAGMGGSGDNFRERLQDDTATRKRAEGAPSSVVDDDDDDDGSGMRWVKKRREARERRKREAEELAAKQKEQEGVIGSDERRESPGHEAEEQLPVEH